MPARRSLVSASAVARELVSARVRAGLTQEQLAEKMQTTQSIIARMESGHTLPSMRTLSRYAEAMGSRAVVRLDGRMKRGVRRTAPGRTATRSPQARGRLTKHFDSHR
ncbi:helix-turn-helix domain-containing protein [Paraburkholderia gardini]|nr:helix-turn-helix transcriptional regulator [Paraburkholderia gardini]